jgi:hypothetical protein
MPEIESWRELPNYEIEPTMGGYGAQIEVIAKPAGNCGSPAGRPPPPDMDDDAGGYASKSTMRGWERSS